MGSDIGFSPSEVVQPVPPLELVHMDGRLFLVVDIES